MKINPKKFNPSKDGELYNVIMKTMQFRANRPKNIIQIGGYDLAEFIVNLILDCQFKNKGIPRYFISEISYSIFQKFYKRYKDVKWVNVQHALSIAVDEALKFIDDDDIYNYPMIQNIYVDSDNPKPFYSLEVQGLLYKDFIIPKDKWLYGLMETNKAHNNLYVLDGCGGIGWLEAQKIFHFNQNLKYDILITNLDHIKNWRTLEYVKRQDDWAISVIRENQWAYLRHYRDSKNRYAKKKYTKYLPEEANYYD